MGTMTAAAGGTFRIGGEIEINRLGFGAMRLTGPGIIGEPADREQCLRTLARLPELGVNFIDTADSYGPHVSEKLIREALYPYDGLLVATKAGLVRPGPSQWTPNGDPAYLRRETEGSLARLGIDRIDLWQLHRIDPKVPRRAQFEAVARMREEGIVRFVGLSQVSVADIEEASDYFPVATVQNLYNLSNRGYDDVLGYCETRGIGFIPWYPLAGGELAREGAQFARIAHQHQATPSQLALAWMLQRSTVTLPIPGTSKVAHLEENVAAASISLTAAEMIALDEAARTPG